jgi:hypothetical protein
MHCHDVPPSLEDSNIGAQSAKTSTGFTWIDLSLPSIAAANLLDWL